MRKALFLICGLFALSTLGAQNANKKTSIGVGISFVDFSGPITEQYFMFDRHKGALNLSISRYLSKTFDVRASLTYGDVWHPNVVGYPNIIEGIYQPASMWDLGFNAMLKFNNGSLIKENARFAPYLLTGIGFNMINGIGNVGVNDDYNAYVPLGVGVNVRLNETFSLGLDGIYKFNVDNSFNYTQSTLKLLTNFGKSKSKEEKAAEATKTEATSAKAVEASTAPATSVNDSFCDHTWSIYAGMGFVDFQTPLTGQPFMFDRYKAVLNIGVQKYLSKFFDLRLGYSYGNVWHPFVTNYPNVENKRMVAATMHEIGLNLLYKLNNGKILNENAIFAPYVFTGVDPNYISGIGDQGVYDDFNVNIPVGVGFNFRTSNRFALAIEGAYKFNVDNSYGFTQAGIKGIYSLGKCRNGSAPAPAAAAAPKVDDADNDGIPDLTDECPFVAGKAEFFGCPDSDGDGIGDSRDKCPFEAGIAQNQGCKGVNNVFEEGTGDTDNDGIADNDDLCPDEAGPSSNNGCPAAGMEVKTSEASENNNTSTNTTTDNSAVNNNNTTTKSGTDKNSNASKGAAAKSNNGKEAVKLSPSTEQNVGQKLVTTYTIAFSSGCSMSPGQIESLQKIASMLRNNPNYTVKINGHTAAGGKSESNMDMSVCRAEKVLGSLKMKGVDVKRTRLTGYGDSRPTGLGAEKDNRVEVEVYVFE
jgi:OOP family OmpA-OmpF porin